MSKILTGTARGNYSKITAHHIKNAAGGYRDIHCNPVASNTKKEKEMRGRISVPGSLVNNDKKATSLKVNQGAEAINKNIVTPGSGFNMTYVLLGMLAVGGIYYYVTYINI